MLRLAWAHRAHRGDSILISHAQRALDLSFSRRAGLPQSRPVLIYRFLSVRKLAKSAGGGQAKRVWAAWPPPAPRPASQATGCKEGVCSMRLECARLDSARAGLCTAMRPLGVSCGGAGGGGVLLQGCEGVLLSLARVIACEAWGELRQVLLPVWCASVLPHGTAAVLGCWGARYGGCDCEAGVHLCCRTRLRRGCVFRGRGQPF